MGLAELASSVEAHFDIGPVRLEPMVGSSQRLWRTGDFVVKEFPYDSSLEAKRRAARFEHEVWRSGRVPMPEPIPSREGALIVFATGSRATGLGIRVHRWVAGERIVDPPPPVTARAGSLLRTIQEAGRRFDTDAPSSRRWWDGDTLDVRDRLNIDVDLDGPLTFLDRAQREHPTGSFTHCDHKAQNALFADGEVFVLDWDECGHCPARLEAVESALRWSVVAGVPERTRFRAFLDAYGFDGPLTDTDFSKWIGALVGWFTFQGRRALGEFGEDTDYERAEALAMAHDALSELRTAMRSLDDWATWF